MKLAFGNRCEIFFMEENQATDYSRNWEYEPVEVGWACCTPKGTESPRESR